MFVVGNSLPWARLALRTLSTFKSNEREAYMVARSIVTQSEENPIRPRKQCKICKGSGKTAMGTCAWCDTGIVRVVGKPTIVWTKDNRLKILNHEAGLMHLRHGNQTITLDFDDGDVLDVEVNYRRAAGAFILSPSKYPKFKEQKEWVIDDRTFPWEGDDSPQQFKIK